MVLPRPTQYPLDYRYLLFNITWSCIAYEELEKDTWSQDAGVRWVPVGNTGNAQLVSWH